MEDALCAFLKPETVQRLQKRARTHPHAQRYLLLLRLSALLIQQAQGEEEASSEWIDQAVTTTTQNLGAMFPGDDNGLYELLSQFAGDIALDYCQRPRTAFNKTKKKAHAIIKGQSACAIAGNVECYLLRGATTSLNMRLARPEQKANLNAKLGNQ